MHSLHDLRATFPRPGRVEWLGLRPERRAPVVAVSEVEAHPLVGLLGDHGKRVPGRLTALSGPAGSEAPPTPEAQATAQVPVRPVASAGPGRRQVTLIQAEHLPVIASLCGLPEVAPEWLRRNVVVRGLPLLALRDRRFWVGEVLLEGTGECHPCSRMEEALGPGGYNAVRGHGGLTARVLQGGLIRLGDELRPCPAGPCMVDG